MMENVYLSSTELEFWVSTYKLQSFGKLFMKS